MKYSKRCECCGHKIAAYTFRLNKSMVASLAKLVDFYNRNRCGAKSKDLGFTTTQYTNFAHLQYWKMAFYDHDKAVWYPTEDGRRFLRGEVPMQDIIGYMIGQGALPLEHEAWKTHKTPVKMVYVYEVDYNDEMKERRDY